MAMRGEVLVAIINKQLDFATARDEYWYRVPVGSAAKWLHHRWPPQWLALYQTAIFGPEKYAVNYYARIQRICIVFRWQLFPNEPRDERSQQRYYQLWFDPLQRLPQPIVSQRPRRIIFIPTTWAKFSTAVEVNDLYDDSPLEDRLWCELKRRAIRAERQEFITIADARYAPDFTIRCAKGKIAIETDGDTWHANPKKAAQDNLRDNELKAVGWRVLRFSSRQIQEQVAEYCIPMIAKLINHLGGLEDGGLVPRKIELQAPERMEQLRLFDGL